MIKAILKGIFKLIIALVNLILLPIDSLINSAFPSIASAISYIDSFFNHILSFIPWIMSWLHLPSIFITFVVGYFTFKLTLPLAVHTIKLALKWYDKLKP